MTPAPIPAVYSAAYQASGLAHFQRLAETCRLGLEAGLVQVYEPQPVDLASLGDLHEPEYLDAMRNGREPLARTPYLPWSPGLLDTAASMLGGQLLGVKLAAEHGVCINLACGFHHAHPGRGGGYCIFNGLALVALRNPQLKVMVLDCDEHGGDGTETYCALLPNLSAVSIFGSRFGIRGGLRSWALAVPRGDPANTDRAFLQALDHGLELVIEQRPDLLLYQASADSHQDDPKATLRLATQTLAERDRRVFSTLRQLGIPVLVTLAGGYQAPQRVARLYLQTLEVAAHEYGRSAVAAEPAMAARGSEDALI